MAKVYISGPMRGVPYYNFPAFDEVAARFKGYGWLVVNPADLDRSNGFDPSGLSEDHDWHSTEGLDLRQAFRRDCDAICGCDHMVVLPGWEKSKGATAEHALAVALGLTILDHDGVELADDTANPKDRIGSRKPQLHTVPASANILEAAVLTLGASKYGAFNWRETKVSASVYVSALLRHLSQWFDGEDADTESGVSHLAHARANLSILIDAMHCETLIDDRPASGPSSKLITALTTGD